MTTTKSGVPTGILIYGVAANDNTPAAPDVAYSAALPPPDANLYVRVDKMDNHTAGPNGESTAPQVDIAIRSRPLGNGQALTADL